MMNTNFSATGGSLTGLRKLIHQAIINDFQTFIPVEDRQQDTFTHSSQQD